MNPTYSLANGLLLCLSLVLTLGVTPAGAETGFPTGSELLAQVESAMPKTRIELTGDLMRRNRDGSHAGTSRIDALLDLGADPPRTEYRVRDAFGAEQQTLIITWPETGQAECEYSFQGETRKLPPAEMNAFVEDLDFSWGDLALTFLRWTNAVTVGRERVKGRECFVVDAYPPEETSNDHWVRLWIEPKIGVLLKAEIYDREGDRKRQVQVKSFRKIQDMWMIQDMAFQRFPERSQTRLRVRDVKRLSTETLEKAVGTQQKD